MITSLPIHIHSPEPLIQHQDKLMLIGSCFTEHIGKRLSDAKFRVAENSHGILFNPLSVVKSIECYIDETMIEENELFYLNEIWNHWDFHTRFSAVDPQLARCEMNTSVQSAHRFLKEADWLMITLGSAFQYFLKDGDRDVANCHRAPGQWFEKKLLSIAQISSALDKMISRLKAFNPYLNIIFTISPVRHIRDGVVENNRSKARLIEAVHEMVQQYTHCHYFPAYELIIDVLRDYRYYDVDMVHPNFAATGVVWDQFCKAYLSPAAQQVAVKMQELTTAVNHKVRFPETQAYEQFRSSQLQKIIRYEQEYPYIDFGKEKMIFTAD